MTANDLDLLRQYAVEKSEDAFAALVNRHLNLVYSAALRLVGSAHLAEEVAQSVFSDLARSAGRLKRDTILTAWLYEVARRTAIDLVRKESRRQSRERAALEINAMNSTASDWTQVEPLLDEAMESLEANDRAAILLRYFENRSLRDVGQALGINEDAAQKRVSRAVERLRESLAQRGVAIGAGSLVAVISANAVPAAPAGLAATIATAAVLAAAGLAATATVTATASTSAATTATAAAAKTIAITTVQKAALATLLAVAVGTGIYEVRHAAQRREGNPIAQPNPMTQAGAAPVAEPSQLAPGTIGELPPVVPISLASLLVPAENDQWDKSSVFKVMPRGKQLLGGIEFWLEGMLQLQSSASRDEGRGYRQRILVPLTETNLAAAGAQIVQQGSNVAAVHLLGATRYGGEGECGVAQLLWRYADGGTQTTPVQFQQHVRDWIRLPYESPTYLPYAFSKAVWRAPVPGLAGRSVRLYRFSYANPEPGRVVQAIELVSAMQHPNLFVVGLTLDPVPLGQRPDDSPNLEPDDPAPGTQIEVAVQTTEGQAIPNAKVRVRVQRPSGKTPASFDHALTTDAQGIARVNYPLAQDLQRLEIAAWHEDHGGRSMSWEMQAGDTVPANYTIKLGNGISIGGQVVDEADTPIPGAKLDFYRAYPGGEHPAQRGEQSDFPSCTTSSDARGFWHLKGVPADLLSRISIRASHPDHVVTNCPV
jgi:RNA polymerase sigma factor (sigma-70 family)